MINMQNKYIHYKIWKIYCSFCIAILLQTILCFPKIWDICPSWVMIMLIYWIVRSPHQVNIGTGFVLGLILDIILGSIMGIHALSFSVISYLLASKVFWFKHMFIWVQTFVLIIFSLINHACFFLVMILFIKTTTYLPRILWNCILDGSMWPITMFIMHKICNVKNHNM